MNWKPETIQQASAIVQVLDMNRMSACQILPSFASAGNRAQFGLHLTQMQADETRITQLSLLIQLNNPAAVEKYIEAYAGSAVAIASSKKPAGEKTGAENIMPLKGTLGSMTTSIPEALEGRTAGDPNTVVPTELLLK